MNGLTRCTEGEPLSLMTMNADLEPSREDDGIP